MAARSVLRGGTHGIGSPDYWSYRDEKSGVDPAKALGMAGLGLYGWSTTEPWEKGSGRSFIKAADTYNRAAKGFEGLALGSSLMDVLRPGADFDPSVYKDESTGEPMTRSAVHKAREAVAKQSGQEYTSPGGEAFRNGVDRGNGLRNLSDWALASTPWGLASMANQLTASEEKPSGRIPVLSGVQKARDALSKKISESTIGKGITKGLGTVYDKTIGKVMDTAPARAIHAGVETGYNLADKAAGGLLPGGQKAGEGYVAKGYGKVDEFMGGILPGGQSPSEVKAGKAEDKAETQKMHDWGYSVARGFESIEDSLLYTTQDYSDYMEYIGPEGIEMIARQRYEKNKADSMLTDYEGQKKASDEVERMQTWYRNREAEKWLETGPKEINTAGAGMTAVLGIPGLGPPGASSEPTAKEDRDTLNYALAERKFDDVSEKAASRIADLLMRKGGTANPGAMAGIADRIDAKLEAKTDREFEERAAELARERALERARERIRR